MAGNEVSKLREDLSAATNALLIAEERALAGLVSLEKMHEVRNFADAIGQFVYLASQNAERPEKVRSFLAAAEQQLEGLGQLTRESLRFSRKYKDVTHSDLVILADTAVAAHQHRLSNKKIHLVRKNPEKLIAPVHSGAMLQVIANLIINSIEALPDSGTMWLRIRKDSRSISLVVADNGRGIPADLYSQIFRPFFTTKPISGTGLGLALTKKIVEGHGGSIRMRSSVRPGKSGTIFRVCLPVEAA